MALPEALVERLTKRGISIPSPPKPNEFVFKRDYKGFSCCPNKSNIYHDCNSWCEINWKAPNVPDPDYVLRVGRLLQKYPLPRSWTEVYDRGMKRYYFWDMETDFVSWLPPRHPKAKPSVCAAKKREERLKQAALEDKNIQKFENIKNRKRSKASTKPHYRRITSERRVKHEDKKNVRRSKHNYVDPMDPAAYSHIPIGTWSDGLDNRKSESVNGYSFNKGKKHISFGINPR